MSSNTSQYRKPRLPNHFRSLALSLLLVRAVSKKKSKGSVRILVVAKSQVELARLDFDVFLFFLRSIGGRTVRALSDHSMSRVAPLGRLPSIDVKNSKDGRNKGSDSSAGAAEEEYVTRRNTSVQTTDSPIIIFGVPNHEKYTNRIVLCCQAVIVTTSHHRRRQLQSGCRNLAFTPKDHLSFSFWSFGERERKR